MKPKSSTASGTKSTLIIEGPLNLAALRILRGFGRAEVLISPHAILRLGKRAFPLEVTYVTRVGAADAWQIVRNRQTASGKVVFLAMAERTSAEARQILTDHNVAYVDGVGNAYFDLPGFYHYVELPPTKQVATRSSEAPKFSGKAGVAIQTLLLDPDREWGVSELADRAAVSLGSAHAVLDRLEQLGIAESSGGKRSETRRIVDRAAMLDTWVEENRDVGVRSVGAYVLAPRDGDLAKALAQRLNKSGIEYALTGVGAADRLAPWLTAIPTTTVWVDEGYPFDDVIAAIEGEATDRGANVFLRQAKGNLSLAFASTKDEIRIANVFRIYFDARNDPRRGREQADHLRSEVIGF